MSLDIPHLQIAVEYEDDEEGYTWHLPKHDGDFSPAGTVPVNSKQ